MSLDVYLILPGEPQRIDVSERIFVREGGTTREVTRAEWDEMQPGREPVAMVAEMDAREVYEANITHNLAKMASECGLYEPLWAPEEINATLAEHLTTAISAGLELLRADRERFEQFNPANGWGDYDLLVRFAENYLAACERWPAAEVQVSR